MYIMDNIAYEPDERFSPVGGEFWLYNDGTIPLTEKDIDHVLLRDYYNRLTSLMELCDGVACTDNNPLMK